MGYVNLAIQDSRPPVSELFMAHQGVSGGTHKPNLHSFARKG